MVKKKLSCCPLLLKSLHLHQHFQPSTVLLSTAQVLIHSSTPRIFIFHLLSVSRPTGAGAGKRRAAYPPTHAPACSEGWGGRAVPGSCTVPQGCTHRPELRGGWRCHTKRGHFHVTMKVYHEVHFSPGSPGWNNFSLFRALGTYGTSCIPCVALDISLTFPHL